MSAVVRRRVPSVLWTATLLVGCVEPVDATGPGSGTRIESVEAVPVSPSQVRLAVDLSAPAPIAAACVRRDRPAEVHLVESDGTGPELVFVGLLAGTDYDCKVSPLDGSGEAVGTSFRTADLPTEAATATVEGDPAAATGPYTVANVRPECHGIHLNYMTVFDPEGNNRLHHELPAGPNLGVEVRSDGPNRLLWGGGEVAGVGAPTVVDLVEGDVWRLEFPGSEDVIFHHDAKRIADGRILSLEMTDDLGWDAFQLRLSDEEGNTTWFYDAVDGVASGWLRPGGSGMRDPHHANWADVVDAGDGPVAYVSLCFAFQIVAIDATDGSPVWKFGHGGDFTLEDPSGEPLPSDEFPECQHGVSVDGERLLIYDNGFNRGFTRVVEFELDTDRMVATKTWDWRDEGFWEKYHGGAEWLPDDRILVVEAHHDCGEDVDRPTQVVEVDRTTDQPVHRLLLAKDGGHWVYNAHRVDGCDLFANAEYCPAVAERLEELRPILGL